MKQDIIYQNCEGYSEYFIWSFDVGYINYVKIVAKNFTTYIMAKILSSLKKSINSIYI